MPWMLMEDWPYGYHPELAVLQATLSTQLLEDGCRNTTFRMAAERSEAGMQPTDGQPAPSRDPSASSASIYNQQTVSKHGSQRFTSKSRPDMQVGVEDTTQPMWAASHTVQDPAGPYTRRAHSVSPDRLDGRRNSDGVEVT